MCLCGIAPSGPPSSVTVAFVTFESVSLEITQPAVEERNGEILGYEIIFTQLSTGVSQSFTAPRIDGQENVLFAATDLLPETTYSYTVAASTSIGTGPARESPTVTTTAIGNKISH